MPLAIACGIVITCLSFTLPLSYFLWKFLDPVYRFQLNFRLYGSNRNWTEEKPLLCEQLKIFCKSSVKKDSLQSIDKTLIETTGHTLAAWSVKLGFSQFLNRLLNDLKVDLTEDLFSEACKSQQTRILKILIKNAKGFEWQPLVFDNSLAQKSMLDHENNQFGRYLKTLYKQHFHEDFSNAPQESSNDVNFINTYNPDGMTSVFKLQMACHSAPFQGLLLALKLNMIDLQNQWCLHIGNDLSYQDVKKMAFEFAALNSESGLLSVEGVLLLKDRFHLNNPFLEISPGNRTSLIHYCIEKNNGELLNALLSPSSVQDPVDSEGNTPLHLACTKGRLNLVETCVQHGMNLMAINKDGEMPIHVAANRKCSQIIIYLAKMMLEQGLNCNPPKETNGMTPLHLAVIFDDVQIVEFYAQFLPDLDILDHEGKSPLNYAQSLKKSKTETILLQSDF